MSMKAILVEEGYSISIRRLCKVLQISRTAVYREPRKRRHYAMDIDLVHEIRIIIDTYPTYGLRRIVWRINLGRQQRVNRKAVHRILKLKGWQMHRRPKGMRPRIKSWVSATDVPNSRWSIDTTHLFTQQDGWVHMTAIIDCCDRSIVGYRISTSGKSDVAVAALEDAIAVRKPKPGLTLRSDNGLVFGSKCFTKEAKKSGIAQEYITPYMPEQNGLIERWFRTLKEECAWLHNFRNLDHTRAEIDKFVTQYNHERPHSSLGMLTPTQWLEKYAA